MPEKFEVLDVGSEGRVKVYSFDPNAEFNGHTFIKFQRKTIFKKEIKWQTLTVDPKDWNDFAEWLAYILEEMHNQGDGQFQDQRAEEVPF